MLAKPRPPEAEVEALAEAASLDALYGHLTPEQIIERAVRDHFAGEIAAVSSFGADSAVLLNMIAGIDRNLPVLFLDTGKHFEETLSYRDALIADFGLSDVRVLTPDEAALAKARPRRQAAPGQHRRLLRNPQGRAAWPAGLHPSAPGLPAASGSRRRHDPRCRCSNRSAPASA